MQFIINHWVLWLALIVVIALLVMEEKRGTAKGIKKISPQAAVNLINHEAAKIVDVRGEADFRTGHLPDSIHIPYDELEKNSNKLTKYKSKPIIVVCGAGPISIKAGILLEKQGFEQVYSLTGGISGWQRSGLPLTKD